MYIHRWFKTFDVQPGKSGITEPCYQLLVFKGLDSSLYFRIQTKELTEHADVTAYQKDAERNKAFDAFDSDAAKIQVCKMLGLKPPVIPKPKPVKKVIETDVDDLF